MADNVGIVRSPFSWQRQLQGWNQAKLAASLSYPFLTNAQMTYWRVFLASLQGVANAFQFGDPMNQGPQNPGATAGSVTGSGQIGTTLITSSSGLTPGDWFQIGYRLYMVLSVSGGTLGIWPPIRESPAGGSNLIIHDTQGLFCLTKNERGYGVSVDNGRNYSLVFEIEEAL